MLFFPCTSTGYVWHWSRQQKKWWTWHHDVCPSAHPVPPATPTGTTLSAGALYGLSARWPVLKVEKCHKQMKLNFLYKTCSLQVLFLPDEENTTEHTPTHHMLQPPQAVFPACICAAVLPIVHLMEDGEVREDGVAGSCHYTKKWICIRNFVIFFWLFMQKCFLSECCCPANPLELPHWRSSSRSPPLPGKADSEQQTGRQTPADRRGKETRNEFFIVCPFVWFLHQDELMYMLRKLLLNIGDLPAQTSHILFNYLVGHQLPSPVPLHLLSVLFILFPLISPPLRWAWSCILCGLPVNGAWTPSRPRWPSCGRWSATWRGSSLKTWSRPWRKSSVRSNCWSQHRCQVNAKYCRHT